MSHDNKKYSRNLAPSEFPRKVLLCVTGLSPQVVTESLYALAVHQSPKFVPTEIRVITTKEGADRIRMTLLEEERWFQRLCEDYALTNIQFSNELIQVLVGEKNQPLDDIRTQLDNKLAADQITEYVRQLTADADSAIHASIAGGRKSMGLFLGYALSLYGRLQDRLSHVLVSSPFESNPKFFYPTQTDQIIYSSAQDNRPYNARYADITLANIDFVRLRDKLPLVALEDSKHFKDIVAVAQQAIDPAELTIDLVNKKVLAADKTIRFPPLLLSFLAWFARMKKVGKGWIPCPSDGVPEPGYAEEFLQEYRKVIGEMGDAERTIQRLRTGMTRNFFSQTKTKTLSRLKKHLDEVEAAPYLISKKKPDKVWLYGLNLPAERIYFKEI